MRQALTQVIYEIEKAITGKRPVIEKLLMALLSDGHVLLDDVPGVGKTTLAVALSRAAGLTSRRVQFTPDVLPSDIVGFTMYEKASGAFIYRPGAVNDVNLVLGDEINRASSRTQSALLEAMEERQVTVDGETHPMEDPFLVIATQNSVGAAGTQPLPYAQMDRFFVRLSLGYPDLAAQTALLRARTDKNPLDDISAAVTREQVIDMRDQARRVTVSDGILDYIARLTIASHDFSLFELGISPRGAVFLSRAARTRAWMDGRDYVVGADVHAVLTDVCAHRVTLSAEAAEKGLSAEAALKRLIDSVPSPDRQGLLGGTGR